MSNFNNAAFVTLTYERTSNKTDTWLRTTTTVNRYIQRLSRLYGTIHYLRAFEDHKDGYPHVHLLILFEKQGNIRDRGKFLQEKYFRGIKDAWPHGLSDAQSPKYSNRGVLTYITKYLSKSTSINTLWSRILDPSVLTAPKATELGYPLKPPSGKLVWKFVLIRKEEKLTYSILEMKRIKLLSWSRDFPKMYKIACNS